MQQRNQNPKHTKEETGDTRGDTGGNFTKDITQNELTNTRGMTKTIHKYVMTRNRWGGAAGEGSVADEQHTDRQGETNKQPEAEKSLTLCRSLFLINPAAPSISEMSLRYLSLVFSLARSNSFFTCCFSSSVFLFPLFDVGDGGAFFGSVVVVCSPPLFAVWAWAYLTR